MVAVDPEFITISCLCIHLILQRWRAVFANGTNKQTNKNECSTWNFFFVERAFLYIEIDVVVIRVGFYGNRISAGGINYLKYVVQNHRANLTQFQCWCFRVTGDLLTQLHNHMDMFFFLRCKCRCVRTGIVIGWKIGWRIKWLVDVANIHFLHLKCDENRFPPIWRWFCCVWTHTKRYIHAKKTVIMKLIAK